MPTDRLTVDERPAFERMAFALAGIGLAAGLASTLMGARFLHAQLLVIAVTGAALLAASTLRGDDATLPWPVRWLLLGIAALVGAVESLPVLALALGGFAGFALAGTNAQPARRRLVGFGSGVAGAAWALAIVPRLDALPLPAGVRAVLMGGAAGLLVGVALLGLHVKVHADALAARLGDDRLAKLWTRCHAALKGAPRPEKRTLLRLLGTGAEKALGLTKSLAALDARLKAVDRTDAEAQVAQLRADAEATRDSMVRQRLQDAAASLGNSLEALDALERKRERLGADLRLEVATLERAALSLEGAQGAEELRAVALRLTATGTTHPA